MAVNRYLIVNADDFGQSPGVNQGIIQAHEHGIVTSASLMVRWPAAVAAATYARVHPEISIGLHVDLGESIYCDDEWKVLYEVVAPDDRAAVLAEATRQLDAFRRLMARDPTHIDSHQHVHREDPVLSVLAEMARELRVPLRHFSPTVQYCGDFYGQDGKGRTYAEGIGSDALIRLIAQLHPGITELACHPGYGDDVDSMYRTERAMEINSLCDPRVRAVIDAHGIQLDSFNLLARKSDL